MKRIAISIIVLISAWNTLYAQNVRTIILRGSVMDSVSKKPVEGAIVQWVDAQGEKVGGSVTSSTGRFEIKGSSTSGEGNLYVQNTGYALVRLSLSAAVLSGNGNLGLLYLHPLYQGLKEVTVTAQKQAYRIEPDKRVFAVESSLAAKGGTIAEVFRQVPGVTVSPSGKLTLRNSTPVLLVDGKRTDLSLDQIPADQVASIEIITNPSAKYDASGNSGIINIITKKNRKPGINGTLNANWSTIPEYNVYGDLNLSKGQFRLNLNYLQHGHRSEYKETLNRDDLVSHTTLAQHGRSVTHGPFRKGKFALDWLPDKYNVLSLSGDVGGGNFHTRHDQLTHYADKNGIVDSGASRITDVEEDFRFAHAGLDYSRQFVKANEQLTASLSLETYKGPNVGSYHMQHQDEQGDPAGLPVLQQYSGGIHAHTIVLRSDYSDPLRSGKARLETGFKITWHKDHNQNLMQDYDQAAGKYKTNPYATYNFRYEDPTYAAYGNYSDQYGRFSYMAGLRFEQYDYQGLMIDSGVTIAYHNPGLYPSLFLSEKIGRSSELHLNYSRRVSRPAFDEISPLTDYSNPQNLFRGNPNLQSEHTNLVEFSYNQQAGKIDLMATLYLRNTNQAITTFTAAVAADTLLTTYINARYNNTYGGELVLKIPVANWWDVTANANLFDTHIAATHLSEGFDNSGLGWFAKLSSHTRLPQDITLELSADYESPKVVPQGKTLSTGSVGFAMGKSFLKKKNATVTLSVTDIFNTDRDKTRTSLAKQFSQVNTQKYLTRMFRINFSYQFGSADKTAVKHATDNVGGEVP